MTLELTPDLLKRIEVAYNHGETTLPGPFVQQHRLDPGKVESMLRALRRLGLLTDGTCPRCGQSVAGAGRE